jgi:siroheme synthase-like protein
VAFSYPIVLDLTDVPVLLVGGGDVALRKAKGLVAAGAVVTVVAPEVDDELAAAVAAVHRRPYAAADVTGHRLVLTATDDPEVNGRVAGDAQAAGVWVNSADDPERCTFILPAVVREGRVLAAVTTGGSSPALASHLRDEIAATVIRPGVDEAAADLADQRAAVHAAGASTEDVDWGERVRAALSRSRK